MSAFREKNDCGAHDVIVLGRPLLCRSRQTEEGLEDGQLPRADGHQQHDRHRDRREDHVDAEFGHAPRVQLDHQLHRVQRFSRLRQNLIREDTEFIGVRVSLDFGAYTFRTYIYQIFIFHRFHRALC